MQWFMKILREGHCQWQNPFNAAQQQMVKFDGVKAIVFWSKNPAPLLPFLPEIVDFGKKFYFQFTLNDYEIENLEPGIPPLEKRMAIFSQLAKDYKVIWRYDPIIMGDGLSVKRHLQKIENLMKHIGHDTEKLVFSFVDLYGRVAGNMGKFNSELRAPWQEEMREIAQGILELRDKIAPKLRLATCAEEIDFKALGIEKNSCIDPALINEICNEQIYQERRSLMGSSFEKDKGQRKACGCAPSKDIGSYRGQRCGHQCVYCYAGHAAVM